MKSSIYIESTIPSYYVARPSRDIISLARQEITRIWWEEYRENYDIYISQLLLEECSRGDKSISKKRVNIIKDIPVLILNNDVISIVETIISKKIIPETAIDDAIHIGITCVYGIDFLLTWNFRHIANAHIIRQLQETVEKMDFIFPVITTPEELIGGEL